MCHMFAYSMPYCVCYDVSCVCLPTTLCDHIQWYVWFPPKTKQTPFNPMCLLQPTFYPMCAPLTPFEPMCLQLDPMSAPHDPIQSHVSPSPCLTSTVNLCPSVLGFEFIYMSSRFWFIFVESYSNCHCMVSSLILTAPCPNEVKSCNRVWHQALQSAGNSFWISVG